MPGNVVIHVRRTLITAVIAYGAWVLSYVWAGDTGTGSGCFDRYNRAVGILFPFSVSPYSTMVTAACALARGTDQEVAEDGKLPARISELLLPRPRTRVRCLSGDRRLVLPGGIEILGGLGSVSSESSLW